MKHSIKLFAFKNNTTLVNFIGHLETIPELVTFVVCPDNDAILLEFDAVNTSQVYYATDLDNCLNKPLVAVGRDCGANTRLNDWEKEQLFLKSFTN